MSEPYFKCLLNKCRNCDKEQKSMIAFFDIPTPVDDEYKDVVYEYMGEDHVDINGALKGHTSVEEKTIEQIMMLDMLFSEVPDSDESIVVFKGTENYNYEIDKFIIFPGFFSTSYNFEATYDFYKGAVLKIKVPSGKKYLKLRVDKLGNEDEVLFPRGVILQVENIETIKFCYYKRHMKEVKLVTVSMI